MSIQQAEGEGEGEGGEDSGRVYLLASQWTRVTRGCRRASIYLTMHVGGSYLCTFDSCKKDSDVR